MHCVSVLLQLIYTRTPPKFNGTIEILAPLSCSHKRDCMYLHIIPFLYLIQKEVEYITEENKKQYGLHDVVLPLPGYDVMLPSNKGNVCVVCVCSVCVVCVDTCVVCCVVCV